MYQVVNWDFVCLFYCFFSNANKHGLWWYWWSEALDRRGCSHLFNLPVILPFYCCSLLSYEGGVLPLQYSWRVSWNVYELVCCSFSLFFLLAGWSMFSVCWVLRVIMNKVGSLLLSFCLLKVMWADVLVWAVSLCVWYLFACQPCVLEIYLHIMISNEDVFLFNSWIDRSLCITGTVPLGGQRGSHLRYASLWILAWCSGA